MIYWNFAKASLTRRSKHLTTKLGHTENDDGASNM